MLEYWKKQNNKEIELLLEAIKKESQDPYNVYNDFFKQEGKMSIDTEILEIYRDLKAENRIINNKIETTKWLLTILITIFGIVTPLMFSLHARSIDAKFDTINANIKTNQQELFNEIKLLRNDFQNLKELNKVEIEKEVLKQTRH